MSQQTSKDTPATKGRKQADQYNDPSHDYVRYWDGRQYEHAAEEAAIKRLLRGKHFHLAVDIGGGYGRLAVLLVQYATTVILAEPSQQQLDVAEGFLKPYPDISYQLMQADNLAFEDASVDLVAMIRVMHHLPDPTAELAEVARVLTADGYGVIELANYAHMRNRLTLMVQGKRLPTEPVDIRSERNRRADVIPFVNHNPKTFIRQLALAGLRVERSLSVSNLRHPAVKSAVPLRFMLFVERMVQEPFAPIFFGPSIFFLVRKSR